MKNNSFFLIFVLTITATFSVIGIPKIDAQNTMKTKTLGDIEFVFIEGGEFLMGSPVGIGQPNEHPQHKVTVSSFWMSKYEVTQKQYTEIIGWNQSIFKGDNLPVETISMGGAEYFCDKLNQKYGEKVRLPYEAEWEYACRAGSKTKYSWGDTIDGKYCWYSGNSDSKTHPVGQKLPNAWGLYDMCGNVWEWCKDGYGDYSGIDQVNPKGPINGQLGVERGGSWYDFEDYVQSASRRYRSPDFRDHSVGFRVVMEVK